MTSSASSINKVSTHRFIAQSPFTHGLNKKKKHSRHGVFAGASSQGTIFD
jgi:hypothetical protein